MRKHALSEHVPPGLLCLSLPSCVLTYQHHRHVHCVRASLLTFNGYDSGQLSMRLEARGCCCAIVVVVVAAATTPKKRFQQHPAATNVSSSDDIVTSTTRARFSTFFSLLAHFFAPSPPPACTQVHLVHVCFSYSNFMSAGEGGGG